MRRIIESTLVSADGVVGDPQFWAMEYRDAEVQADALRRLAGADAMLLGRGTYEVFAGTWSRQTGDFADRMNGIPKYVFSSTLQQADWANTTIVRGDVVAEVTKLKEEPGGELAVWGHGLFSQTLFESGLTDEVRLSVHPVFAGGGRLLFHEGKKTRMKLLSSAALGTGVVVLSYEIERA